MRGNFRKRGYVMKRTEMHWVLDGLGALGDYFHETGFEIILRENTIVVRSISVPQ